MLVEVAKERVIIHSEACTALTLTKRVLRNEAITPKATGKKG